MPLYFGQNAVSLFGNTTGVLAGISTGTVYLAGGNNITLSQNNNSVTVSAPILMNQISVAGGNVDGANIAISSGAITFAGGTNISVTKTQQTLSWAMDDMGAPALSMWNNANPNNVFQIAINDQALVVGPLDLLNFPGFMTINTMLLDLSVSMTAVTGASTGAFTSTYYVGLYTLNNFTLSLWNSVSSSYGHAASTNISASVHGLRFFSFHSSQWSSAPNMSPGQYFLGLMVKTAGVSHPTSAGHGFYYNAAARSGTLGVSSATSIEQGYGLPQGGYIALTGGMPISIPNASLSKGGFNFYPYVIFNNITSVL